MRVDLPTLGQRFDRHTHDKALIAFHLRERTGLAFGEEAGPALKRGVIHDQSNI